MYFYVFVVLYTQTFYRSLVNTVCSFLFVVFYTHSLVLMLLYHISTTKHSTVPVFILYVLLCVCCILHTITSTNVTISHINNYTFYRSLVYMVCSVMWLICDIVTLVLVIVCTIQQTHKRTYSINKWTVECLVVDKNTLFKHGNGRMFDCWYLIL
jgi:hypothetical protein